MKKSNKFSAFFLIIFISVFSFLTFFRHETDESLTEFPEMTWDNILDGSYSIQLSNFFVDNFAGHDKWVSVSAKIKSWLSESIVNDVYISKNRLLSVDTAAMGSTEKSADIINEFVRSYDGTLYFTAVPTSSGVYSDMLPSYLLLTTEKQQIDTLYEQLDTSIRKIDAYNILKMLSNNYIYYRSDSKWTSYGAFCVYRTVIQKLGFMPVSYDKYTIEHITNDYKGNLYVRTQYMESKPDLLDICTYSNSSEIISCTGYDNSGMTYKKNLYERKAVDSDDMYKLYLGEKMPFIKINTSVNNNKKLLVIGDDYASCFIPFLTQHYSEIAVVFPECMEKNLKRFLNPDDYEQTLFLFGIDSLDDDIFNYMR